MVRWPIIRTAKINFLNSGCMFTTVMNLTKTSQQLIITADATLLLALHLTFVKTEETIAALLKSTEEIKKLTGFIKPLRLDDAFLRATVLCLSKVPWNYNTSKRIGKNVPANRTKGGWVKNESQYRQKMQFASSFVSKYLQYYTGWRGTI